MRWRIHTACRAELAQEIGALSRRPRSTAIPIPAATALKAALRKAMGVPDGMDMLLGNGSDELIQILAFAVNRPGAVL